MSGKQTVFAVCLSVTGMGVPQTSVEMSLRPSHVQCYLRGRAAQKCCVEAAEQSGLLRVTIGQGSI